MNRTRIILILCVFLLCACLVFAVTALTVLRNAVAETEQVRRDAQSMLDDMEDVLRQARTDSQKQPEESRDARQVGVLYDRFCIRESNGRVAVYTESGELVRLTDILTATLPRSDRDALRNGIRFTSWKEVLSLLQDWE